MIKEKFMDGIAKMASAGGNYEKELSVAAWNEFTGRGGESRRDVMSRHGMHVLLGGKPTDFISLLIDGRIR